MYILGWTSGCERRGSSGFHGNHCIPPMNITANVTDGILHRDPGVGQPSQGKVELSVSPASCLVLNSGLWANSSKALQVEATMTLVHTGMDNRPICARISSYCQCSYRDLVDLYTVLIQYSELKVAKSVPVCLP